MNGIPAVCRHYGFNPRARAGRDLPKRWLVLSWQLFQSTRPRGARPNALELFTRYLSFNPRARAGRDLGSIGVYLGGISFNPRARAGRD